MLLCQALYGSLYEVDQGEGVVVGSCVASCIGALLHGSHASGPDLVISHQPCVLTCIWHVLVKI